MSASLISLPPDPSSALISKQSPARARAGRPDGHEYHAEFDRIWDACRGSRSKGNKLPAYREWLKDKPSADLTIAAWALWMTTSDWSAGYSPDMRKWFHNRGWADKPSPEAFRSRQGDTGRAPESFQARDERERQERAQRQRETFGEESARTQTPGRCARHLYNQTWGDCNPRCPEWKGARSAG